jgi:succinate dehydrogenase hydrophobic anchor subunit
MSVIEIPHGTPPTQTETHAYPGGRSARAWRWTAGTGVALVALATIHIVAQHFVVRQTGGLRTYHQVLEYISNPVIFVIECGFLFAVTIHAMLGIRSVVLDLDLHPRTQRQIHVGLWVLGTLTVAWGLVLLITLAVRA